MGEAKGSEDFPPATLNKHHVMVQLYPHTSLNLTRCSDYDSEPYGQILAMSSMCNLSQGKMFNSSIAYFILGGRGT